MNETGHPSRLSLDLAMIGAATGEDATHIAACARCGAALKEMENARDQLLKAHPRLERSGQRRTRILPRVLAACALAAAIAIVALMVRPAPEPTRMKGVTAAELFVKRGTETFAFDGRKLAAGDTLMFRYTTQRKHLLVIDAEASGKIEVVIDQPIEPGTEKLAPSGVALDDYRGDERVIALFSDAKLDAAALLLALRSGGALPKVDADEKSWRIEKEKP